MSEEGIALAVVGSRNWQNYKLIDETLSRYNNIALVVSGGAAGADTLAEMWAKNKGIPTKIIEPDWRMFGKKAGYMRNVEIVEAADEVVAFWDGDSKGTQHSFELAANMGKPITIVEEPKDE